MPNTNEYQYIIETLKAKNQDKQNYYIYPVTKESAITDKNGICLEDKLIQIQASINNQAITRATIPTNLWQPNGTIYTATIANLTLDSNTDYEIVIDHTTLDDSVYMSLTSCFIIPSNYTNSTLTLKALLQQPSNEFSILIIRR